jgi:hypothetical protein
VIPGLISKLGGYLPMQTFTPQSSLAFFAHHPIKIAQNRSKSFTLICRLTLRHHQGCLAPFLWPLAWLASTGPWGLSLSTFLAFGKMWNTTCPALLQTGYGVCIDPLVFGLGVTNHQKCTTNLHQKCTTWQIKISQCY